MYIDSYVSEYYMIESSEITMIPNTLLILLCVLLQMACVVYDAFNLSHYNKHLKNTSPSK